MKKLLIIAIIFISKTVLAANNLAFVDMNTVLNNSKVVTSRFKEIDNLYNKQTQSYKEKQAKIETELDKVMKNGEKNSQRVDNLSLQEKQLQEAIESLNKSHDKQLIDLKNQYVVFVKRAADQIRKQNHYHYIFSSSMLLSSEPQDDISLTVAKLADTLYLQARKK